MRVPRRRSGYTLLEVLVVLGIMGLITTGALTMMVSAASCFDNTNTEAFTDTDAVIAMQKIVNDVREAKSVSIISGGMKLRVVFPMRTAQGYYDRHQPDTANAIDYYLSNQTGATDRTGTYLWKGNASSRQLLKKHVIEIAFEQDTSRSVKITIVAQNQAASGPKQTWLTQRVVYLRNY